MLSESLTQRKRDFRKLMIKGIGTHNDCLLGSSTELMRLRKTTKENDIQYQCDNCKMLFVKSSIGRHKNICFNKHPGRKKLPDIQQYITG